MARVKTLGIDAKAPSDNEVILELIQYNEEDYGMQADIPVEELIKQLKPDRVNWINVDGLHDKSIVNSLGEHFNLHPLLIEDVISDHQPKAEEFDGYLFFTMKMLHSIKKGKIEYEQISFVLGKNYLLTFQGKAGDFFGPFRERIKQGAGRIRKSGPDYLLYRLIDIIVENYYTIFDEVGHQIESVEEEIHKKPTTQEFLQIQQIKKELIYLRKALYPLRDALKKLVKDESGLIDEANTRYFDDVRDHMLHLMDALDTYKDLTSGLLDIHINTMNTRLNEVMKVLTMFSTIFMPLTFIVGIYGMNFEHMPEIHTFWGYPAVMIFMTVTVLGMIQYFKYKKWF